MEYEIVKPISDLPRFEVLIDGEEIGTIDPLFKSMNSYRAYAYETNVLLQFDGLADEDGTPNIYRTQSEAFAAVHELMHRNCIPMKGKTDT